MTEKTIEQIRDSRVWDMRDMGFDVSRVEVRPIGDKHVMTMTIERPISIDEDLHPKIAEVATPSQPADEIKESDVQVGADPEAGEAYDQDIGRPGTGGHKQEEAI